MNISFVVSNANALQMDAIFWIEIVQPTDGEVFLQLQHVQRVILDFLRPRLRLTFIGSAFRWPHSSNK